MSFVGFTLLLPMAAALWGLFRLALGGEVRFLVVTLVAASAAMLCYCGWAWLWRDGFESEVYLTHGLAAWGKLWQAARYPLMAWVVIVIVAWLIYKSHKRLPASSRTG
jgi:ribose/xylose/arabinose/galactoside ABC-type transport system permease subunit